MNDVKTAGPEKLKSLRLVRETLRELDTDDPRGGEGGGHRTRHNTCGCSWAAN